MRCSVAVDTGDPRLPVLGAGGVAAIRKSKRSKWRAGVLIGVHVLVAAHLTHYFLAGRTLSPVEPSESAYAIEQGYVRAGAIFFAVALLGTAVFGRFFCGWGCHIVALQDFCGWMMKRLGVRPKPFRSRFLAFVPLAVAFYLLAWPALRRYVFDQSSVSFPGFTNQLMTDDFWQTFPGPWITLLTFITCGFATVYFLGAKGFCTYGCPYGALFGPIDTISAGRIVVNDSCEQCGHCTATCTSNVRVHEEVKLYGMVVDSGCMKCMDCVSVCPKHALRFSFARPSLFKRASSVPRAKRYDLSLAEELLLASVCLFATLSFFRLYDGPPLLMAVGLGGLTAFLALKLWHLFRRSSLAIQNLVLKSAGKVQARGWTFAVGASLWLSFTAHSGFVQWQRASGLSALNRTETTRDELISGAFRQKLYSPRHYRAAREAARRLSLADRWGLVDLLDVNLGQTWADVLQGDLAGAEAHARRAVALAPDQRALTLQNLAYVLVARNRIPMAIETMRSKAELGEPSAADRLQLGWLLAEAGDLEGAAGEYRALVAMVPGSAEAQSGLGGLLRRLGRYDEALDHLRTALQLAPDDADAEVELGRTYLAMGDPDHALRSFKRAVALEPGISESPVGPLIDRLERSGEAEAAGPSR